MPWLMFPLFVQIDYMTQLMLGYFLEDEFVQPHYKCYY